MLTEQEVEAIKPVRYALKVADGAGLCLLVTPAGGRRWRFNYRFAGKYKSLPIGTHLEITLERVRLHHQFARHLLTRGIDPSSLKAPMVNNVAQINGLVFRCRSSLTAM
jgi:hypothetical protein